MVTAGSIVGTYGATSTFTLSGADDGGVQIDSLTWSPIMEGNEISNPDQSGAAESYVQNRSQVISISGKIVGTSAANAVVLLNTLADAVLPDQGTQTDYPHGTLKLTFAGQSEVYCEFVTLRWQPTIEVIGGNVLPYSMDLRNPYGFFRFTSGGAVFKL